MLVWKSSGRGSGTVEGRVRQELGRRLQGMLVAGEALLWMGWV